jgi:hypothetical protein
VEEGALMYRIETIVLGGAYALLAIAIIAMVVH